MPVYKDMTREYQMGAGRDLLVKKNGDVYNIAIFEIASEFRSVSFPISSWSMFTRELREIDNTVSELQTNPQLKYTHHIGGGFYISMTAGFLDQMGFCSQ